MFSPFSFNIRIIIMMVTLLDVKDHLTDAFLSSDLPLSLTSLSRSHQYQPPCLSSCSQLPQPTWEVKPVVEADYSSQPHQILIRITVNSNQVHAARPLAAFHRFLTPALVVALAGSPFIFIFHPRGHHHIHQIYHI